MAVANSPAPYSQPSARWVQVESSSRSSLLFEHDPFGKPASTFPDHALGYIKVQFHISSEFGYLTFRSVARRRRSGTARTVDLTVVAKRPDRVQCVDKRGCRSNLIVGLRKSSNRRMLPNLNRGTDRLVVRFNRHVERIAFYFITAYFIAAWHMSRTLIEPRFRAVH